MGDVVKFGGDTREMDVQKLLKSVRWLTCPCDPRGQWNAALGTACPSCGKPGIEVSTVKN